MVRMASVRGRRLTVLFTCKVVFACANGSHHDHRSGCRYLPDPRPAHIDRGAGITASLQCTAEAFVYGMYSPVPFSATAPVPYTPNTTSPVTSVNAPVIFEPVPALIAVQNQGQVWVAVSSSDRLLWRGFQVYLANTMARVSY